MRRLACTARSQVIVEDHRGNPVHVGRMIGDPPAWMMRHLRYRDGECTFPGCGSRQFAQAHHIRWQVLGGRTELENLVLVCTFHHKLVHEFGWRLKRDPDGTVRWFHPGGKPYRAGPGPPGPSPPSSESVALLRGAVALGR